MIATKILYNIFSKPYPVVGIRSKIGKNLATGVFNPLIFVKKKLSHLQDLREYLEITWSILFSSMLTFNNYTWKRTIVGAKKIIETCIE